MTDTGANDMHELDQRPSAAAGSGRPRQALRLALRALLWVALLIFGGAALAALLVHLQVDQDDLASWQRASGAVKRWGLVVQVGLLALVIARWNAVIGWARRKGIVQAHEFERVLALRWSAALVGLAYLILVPIGPATLWRLLLGA